MKKRQTGGACLPNHAFRQMLLFMNMTFVCLFIFCVQVSAKVYSQTKVSLNLKDVHISKILLAIEEKTEFRFLFDESLFQDKPMSIHVRNQPVTRVVGELLQKQGLSFTMTDEKLIVISANNDFKQKQDLVVRGRVMFGQSGIAGATVTEKGTTNVTVTDSSGAFQIRVAGNESVLVFSSVGYREQEVALNGRTSLLVTLEQSATNLNEVIVIGYGERRKKDVTGSISSIGPREIEKSTSTSPELAIQGRMTGVFVSSGGGSPSARPTVRIRGVNTLGFQDPLYVIDGVPMVEGGAGLSSSTIGASTVQDIRSPINIFSLINPNDIESISVLKDASAAAIYGVRAANGVVLITTKRGKPGRPRVELNTYYGVQQVAKKIDLLNTQQYAQLYQEAYADNPEINAGVPIPIGSSSGFGTAFDPGSPDYLGNSNTYDWQKELENKNARLMDLQVKVSGATENVNYYLSAGYNKTESPLKANFMERYTISSNLTAKINRFIETGFTLRLIQSKTLDNTNGDLSEVTTTPPWQPVYDPNGLNGFATAITPGRFIPNPDYKPGTLSPGAPFIFDGTAGTPAKRWGNQTNTNILGLQSLNETEYSGQRALGSGYLQIQPLKGLKIKGSIGGDVYFNNSEDWNPYKAYVFGETITNPYATQDGNAFSSLSLRQSTTTNLNKELLVHYNHTFFGAHVLDLTAGASEQSYYWSVKQESSAIMDSFSYVNRITSIRESKYPYTDGRNFIPQRYALQGYFGRLSYRYSDKYYLDAVIRRDGSSRFAPGYKYGTFPSFSAAWRISGEQFMTGLRFINDLKIRGGWGELGNEQTTGGFAYLSTINAITAGYSFGSGSGNALGNYLSTVAITNLANSLLSWETTQTSNIGFDAQLFNNRISLTFEYFNKITNGIIQSVALPYSTGIPGSVDLNIAKVRNSGIEFEIGYNQKIGPVNFSASGNFSTVKNRVESLYGKTPFGDDFGRIEEGYPLNFIRGYKIGGIFQSQAEIDAWRKAHADVTTGQSLGTTAGYVYKPGDMYFQDLRTNPGNGKQFPSPGADSLVNDNDKVFLGKTIPSFYYGLNLAANWKSFDISIFFQGVGDVQKFNGERAAGESMSANGPNQWATVLNRWTSSNPSGSMPRASYQDRAGVNRMSERFVEDAGYMRLKNLQIGYAIPPSVLGNTGVISNFRLYLSAVNLFTITNWTGRDPENDAIPVTRQFLIGINAAF
jgi:TonB-linked SusC/RagA family outer membrane protein